MVLGCFFPFVTNYIWPSFIPPFSDLLSLPCISSEANSPRSTYIVVSLSTFWLYVKRLECGGRATAHER